MGRGADPRPIRGCLPVGLASVLHPQNDDPSGVVVDFVYDPVVADAQTPVAQRPFHFSAPVGPRILTQGIDVRSYAVEYAIGEAIEVASRNAPDVDLIHGLLSPADSRLASADQGDGCGSPRVL